MTDRVTVIGNIGQAPQRKTTPKGDVVEFSLARTSRVQAEDGGWRDGETLWYAVSAWDRLGASAEGALRRGNRVIVQGSLHERRWTGNDGVERLSRDLRASAIGHDISQRAPAAGPLAAPVPAASPEPVATGAPAGSPQPEQGGDRGAPARREPLEPAPPGWSTVMEAEGETPF